MEVKKTGTITDVNEGDSEHGWVRFSVGNRREGGAKDRLGGLGEVEEEGRWGWRRKGLDAMEREEGTGRGEGCRGGREKTAEWEREDWME
ncbi:hypothetical protein Pcinc_034414 [Petrolisthes cinctipes]|uniref:Uncharacterized protein n=1 Tax=Petrolisthes cinctipes TaxID=88211 RepID=A0AAE1JVN3_PETCI|nr:hypothetical protein Pcinc_034414 [Petrolisthes cinctipes]